MKKLLKENGEFLLFVLVGGLIGGYCAGLYMYDLLSPELLNQIQEQNITKELYGVVAGIQYGILYGFVLAIIGIILSKKVGLWNKFKFEKKALITTIIITIIAALIIFPGDKIIFGSFSSFVSEQYISSPTLPKIISGFLVGGITEEVMMRLFLMSLLVFIFSKMFYRKAKEIPTRIFVISNILSALLFAAGHLPSTMAMTTLTSVLVIRCFLFNGALGLCFGYLYRKYGIGYAMIAHGFAHLISDILMIIFI